MSLFIIALAVLCIVSLRLSKGMGFLVHSQTTIVNGIFALLIFFSHSTYYLLSFPENAMDSLYRHFQNFHNQWVVTTFLAFSGYGVMLKIKNGGMKYLKKYPRNRLLKTLLNFDVAVFLYLIVDLVLGIQYDTLTIIGSFIGLTSVGNSNWYIFTILLMYLVSYFAALVLRDNYKEIAMAVTVCSVMYVVIAQVTGLPSRFVSTVTTYALGMWVAIYRDELLKLFKGKPVSSIIVISIVILSTYKLRGSDYVMNLNSCFFVLLVVWFMAHFEIKSRVLLFFGTHAFSIYILQRIPFIIISHFYEPKGTMSYVFVIVCLAITIGLAAIFDMLLVKLDKKVIKI